MSNPKLPPEERLRAYALAFSGTLIDDTPPRVPREPELSEAQRVHFQTLHRELVGLRDAVRQQHDPSFDAPYAFDFESGRVTVICPEVPAELRSPLAEEDNANHTRLYRYADLDALIEMWGHLRASNPELRTRHRLSSEITADHLSGHLVLLGGIAYNSVTDRLMRALAELPIRQVEAPDVDDGEIFRLCDGAEFRPVWEEHEDTGLEDAWGGRTPRELVEDVALLVRLRNPFNHSRTITICNGIYSRGVLGAVRILTDDSVRERNEAYLAHRFPGRSYALLLRVPVVNGEAVTPDLEISENRLFEWSPEEPDG